MMKQRVLSDRYRLLVKVGEGGMAEVYRAQDMLLGRAVAVKVLRTQYTKESSFLARFLQEAQAAAGLSHPNIVTVYDVGQDGDLRYIVMEYVEGVSLKEVILESAPFDVDRALNIGIQICQAVGVAHRAGLVHRDVKPQNVLLTSGDRVKVTDFGIALALSAPKGLTEEGTVWGTPHYISPEQAMADEVGPSSDVYSIGVVLFEMLTGQLPFDGESSVAIAMKHVREMPPLASRLNTAVRPELAEIVDRALSKDPEDRYRSAGEFAQVLRSYQRSMDRFPAGQVSVRPHVDIGYPPPPYAPESDIGEGFALPERAGQEGSEQERGLDALTWLFLAAAVLGMIGLIPIGYFIFLAYAAPPPAPKPSPTPTVLILKDDVRVPDLVGLGRDEATSRVLMAGLRLEVTEEKYSDAVPEGRIMEQERPAGELARRGDVIRVVMSKGPEPKTVTLSRFVGQELEAVEQELREKGLSVQSAAQWGGEVAPGIVVRQDPEPGAELMPGATVKLVVSSGPRAEVDAVLGGSIVLKAFELERDRYNLGETIPLTLYWTAREAVSRDYVVFVHLRHDGRNVVERDNPPVYGARPTSGWVPGENIRDPYALVIPGDAPPGQYWLVAGMYDPQSLQRLEVTHQGNVQVADRALLLKQIAVQSR